MLGTNSSCSLYLCQSAFGNINWEKPQGILESWESVPLYSWVTIQNIHQYWPHHGILHCGINPSHYIYLIIDFTFSSVFFKTRYEVLAAKLHFKQFLIREGNELWMEQLFPKWISKTQYFGSWVHWFILDQEVERASWKEIACSLNQSYLKPNLKTCS